MLTFTAALVPLLAARIFAQQIGTNTPEVHPPLTSYQCTKAGGCVKVGTSVVLEESSRSLHKVGGTTSCYNYAFDSTLCPDVTSCGKNCALEGVDYAAHGVSTSGDALTLNLYKTTNGVTSSVSPRVYLLAADNTNYDMFKLLNQEFTFDVDTSKVPCAINGALYLSEMSASGNSSTINTAGAAYGTGYCDAQCPTLSFVNGQVCSFT